MRGKRNSPDERPAREEQALTLALRPYPPGSRATSVVFLPLPGCLTWHITGCATYVFSEYVSNHCDIVDVAVSKFTIELRLKSEESVQ